MSDDAAEVAVLAKQWNDAVLAHVDEDEEPVPASILVPGASEAELVALEARIGVRLPPSYRAFLAFSNGAWSKPGWNALLIPDESRPEAGLLTASQVGWLIDLDPNFVEIWMEGADERADDDLSDEVYFDYSRDDQDSCEIRIRDIPHLLMVSCFDWGSAVFLNPRAVSADGEWEAWEFANSNPGAYRYASFADLLRAQPVAMARWDAEEAEAAARRSTEDEPAVRAALTAFEAGVDWNEGTHLDAVNSIVEPVRWFDRLVGLLDSPQAPVVHAALRAIARVDTPQALDAILSVVQRDPSAPIGAAVMARLVDDPDSRATQAARRLLETRSHAAASVPWTDAGRELIWQAWERTGQPFCLKAVAERHDRRAIDPLCVLLADPTLSAPVRGELAQAATNIPDPRLVPALLAAVRLGGVHLVSIVRFLIQVGALDEAESLITPEALADPTVYRAALEQAQREIARLRRGYRRLGTPISPLPAQPTPAVATAWPSDPL